MGRLFFPCLIEGLLLQIGRGRSGGRWGGGRERESNYNISLFCLGLNNLNMESFLIKRSACLGKYAA